MLMRRLMMTLVLFTSTVAGFSAYAEGVKFTPAASEAAQKSGQPILVDITAPWCPVCEAQRPVINGLTSKDKFKDFVVLEVDYDSQKDVLKSMKASSQSTLIVFKGPAEAGRSAGDTNASSIEALLAKAL